MKTARFLPLVSTLAFAAALLTAPPAQAASRLPRLALDFVRDEFLPTLAALAEAAAREPLTWAAIGLGLVGHALWRRI